VNVSELKGWQTKIDFWVQAFNRFLGRKEKGRQRKVLSLENI